MWEGACSRWRCVSQYMRWLNHCYREQTPSHIGFSVLPRIQRGAETTSICPGFSA